MITGRKKNCLPINYELASLYYDRRMLNVAEASLIRCRDLADTMRDMVASRYSTARAGVSPTKFDSQKVCDRRTEELNATFATESRKARERIQGIQTDIDHVVELQGVYATLTPEVPVLPCLLSRFTEHVADCEQWWREVRSSHLIDWCN
jgi:hypothetical protein